jgi:hypothetical protein
MAVQIFVWPLGLSMELTYVWFLAFFLGALVVDRDGWFALYEVANPECGRPICDLHCKFTV